VDALASLKQQQAAAAASHAARLEAAERAAEQLTTAVQQLKAGAWSPGAPLNGTSGNGVGGGRAGLNGAGKGKLNGTGTAPADPWKEPRHDQGGP
jgi:hypothetical protein